jgi:hypothetical protein
MPTRFASRLLCSAFVFALAAACGGDKPAGDTPAGGTGTPPAADVDPNVLTITARDYAYDAPAEVPAGLTTIRLVNQGPSLHHVQLVKLDDGKTLKDFLEALKGDAFPTSPRPAGGNAPPEADSTTTLIQTLEPGTYAMICFIPAADGMPHLMKGMSRELKVVPATGARAKEPIPDLSVTLLDYDFRFSQPLATGRHLIRVENAGQQPHEIAIIRLEPGRKVMDFYQWAMKPAGPPPGRVYGGVSGIMPSEHVFIDVDLPAGTYALMCFLPDAKDGKSHVEHGMAKETAVPS